MPRGHTCLAWGVSVSATCALNFPLAQTLPVAGISMQGVSYLPDLLQVQDAPAVRLPVLDKHKMQLPWEKQAPVPLLQALQSMQVKPQQGQAGMQALVQVLQVRHTPC